MIYINTVHLFWDNMLIWTCLLIDAWINCTNALICVIKYISDIVVMEKQQAAQLNLWKFASL